MVYSMEVFLVLSLFARSIIVLLEESTIVKGGSVLLRVSIQVELNLDDIGLSASFFVFFLFNGAAYKY